MRSHAGHRRVRICAHVHMRAHAAHADARMPRGRNRRLPMATREGSPTSPQSRRALQESGTLPSKGQGRPTEPAQLQRIIPFRAASRLRACGKRFGACDFRLRTRLTQPPRETSSVCRPSADTRAKLCDCRAVPAHIFARHASRVTCHMAIIVCLKLLLSTGHGPGSMCIHGTLHVRHP